MKENDMLFRLAERFIYHSNKKSDNPVIQETIDSMIDLEISEMWWLTQK